MEFGLEAHIETGISTYERVIGGLHREALLLLSSKSFEDCQAIDWCNRAHEYLQRKASNPEVVTIWQSSLLPFFLRSDFLDRCRSKPRGYAGDYLTIQLMYEAATATEDAFGRAVDSWAMSQPCPRAVRNRRHLVSDLIKELYSAFKKTSLSIVSLGCGPAAEVFENSSFTDIQFHLLDIDPEAVSYIRQRASYIGADDRVRATLANIIKMAVKGDATIPEGQHAFYSLGLIDYFSDSLVVALLNYIHTKLAPGGRALLGNFRSGHPNEAFFTYALEWPLKLRSEEDLLRLVSQSEFRDSVTTVGAEDENVQLFVKCIKR